MDQESPVSSSNPGTDLAVGQDTVFTRMKVRSRPSIDPVAFLFKMKRNRKELLSSREREEDVLLGENAALDFQNEKQDETHGEDDGQVEDQYDPAQVQIEILDDKETQEDSNSEVVSDLFKNRESSGPKKSMNPTASSFAATVTHPWHIVDYHLYLLQIEGKKDLTARRNGVLLRDGVDCRPLSYEEMLEDEDTFDPGLVGEEPSVLFAALPVPEHLIQFNGATYVLEYDWNLRTLGARHFVWVPEDLRNIEYVWSEGVIIYAVPIVEIVDVMKASLAERYRRIEFLSTNSRCTTPYMAHDDPGMELVVAYMFCQFAVDFAEVIFPEEMDHDIENFKSELSSIMEEIRLTLQRASYRAWFAVRDGLSMEKFSQKMSFDRYLNDLFTYNKSVEEGSLRGKKWHAPGLDTCKKIRDTDSNNRRVRNERQLKDLFAPLDKDSHPEPQEAVFERMLVKADEDEANALLDTELPQIPSTPLLYELDFDALDLSPGSPIVVSPTATQDDGFEITEYHHISLWRLLSDTLNLLQTRPELDTLENRGRFGALLTDMGACLIKKSFDEFAIAPSQGFDNDDWILDVHDLSGLEESTQPVRRLLPSPILD